MGRSPLAYAQIVEMKQRKISIATQARELFKKHIVEKRDMSSDESDKFNTLVSQVEDHDTRIAQLEKLGTDDDADGDGSADSDNDTGSKEGDNDNTDKERGRKPVGEQRRAEERGSNAPPVNNPSRRRNKPEAELRRFPMETEDHYRNRQRRSGEGYFKAVADYLVYGNAALAMGENQRNIQADIDIVGGYLVLPEQISNRILKKVDNILQIQQYATVMKIENAQSLGSPTWDADPDDPEWTTEITTINADSGSRMGKRSLTPTPIRKRLLVSERFLRMAFQATFMSADDADGQGGSPDSIIINRLAYKIAATKEKAFFLGNGNSQPLGVFVASSRGISTARDVLTGSATGFSYAGLLAAKFSLKIQYHTRAKWLLHRTAMQQIMGLVDSNGRPLLNFSTLPDTPDSLLQCPVLLSEYVPAVFTSGNYVGLLGDLSYYHIVDSQDVTVKQAQELYMETGQVGFFISAESDGMPVLEEAFSRLKTN